MFVSEAVLHAAKQGAEKYAAEQLDLLRKFSAIDHGTGNVEGNQEIIHLMKEALVSAGVSVTCRENPNHGSHVVARIKPANSTGKIILNSHIDTVFSPGDAAAHPFRIDGDYAYGLGIADCMGGFVVSCYGVKILQEAGLLPPKEIVMIYNNDEEVGSPDGQKVFKEEAAGAEMAFVFEPAREENGVLTYRKGIASCKIEVTGKETHAGLKYTEGSSATVELAHQILALASMSDPSIGMYYNVGPLTGGKGIGTVAGSASAEAAVPLPDAASCDKVRADMQYLEEHVTVPGCTVKTSFNVIFPPMEHTDGNVQLCRRVQQAGAEMGLTLPEQASGGSSDACYFTTYGVPTVDGLGPYMQDIHTFKERLLIPSIQQKTQLFAIVLGSL